MKNEPRIPTLIALIVLLIGLGSGIFVIERGHRLLLQADTASYPQEVTITNVTDTSFSVSWITNTPVVGTLTYQAQSLFSSTTTAFDIRDQAKGRSPRYTHFVNVTNLKPQTTYTVRIISPPPSQRLSYTITTGKTLSPPTHSLNPAFGKLIDTSHSAVTEALVYASFEGSQTLGTIIDPDGTWVIPFGALRSKDLSRYFIPTNKDKKFIFFKNSQGSTTVTTTIDNDSPVPPVMLNESYDFSQKTPNKGVIIAQADTPRPQAVATLNSGFTVLLPKPGAHIPSGKPAFKGWGIPDKQVIITISGLGIPIVGKAKVSPNGYWTWTPPELTPGSYYASLVSFSNTNIPISVTRVFTVLKSGTQVLQAATPSASLVPTSSPIVTGSPLPTASPTLTPTFTPTPVATVTASPSASPPPETGTTEPTVGLILVSSTLLFLGILGTGRLKFN